MNSLMRRIYYPMKTVIPRGFQIYIRQKLARRQLPKNLLTWPISARAGKIPAGWQGWPSGKQFALVLTHDVENAKGLDKCRQIMELEKGLGFRSSFNFVGRRYEVGADLRRGLVRDGFEVGVHGLHHDGRYYQSREIFRRRAMQINSILKDWEAVGFRSPSMERNLDWFHDLDIEYDASTFDTDPFEPQPEGVETIFPFYVHGADDSRGFVELPYTLPQDFTLFVLLQEKDVSIWQRKLDWIVERGGMALLTTHPDYMSFHEREPDLEEYPSRFYGDFLKYIKRNYEGKFWHLLPREMARFWKEEMVFPLSSRQRV